MRQPIVSETLRMLLPAVDTDVACCLAADVEPGRWMEDFLTTAGMKGHRVEKKCPLNFVSSGSSGCIFNPHACMPQTALPVDHPDETVAQHESRAFMRFTWTQMFVPPSRIRTRL